MGNIITSTITLELKGKNPISLEHAKELAYDYCNKHNHILEDFGIISQKTDSEIITHINIFVK